MYNYYPQQQVASSLMRQPAMTPFILKGRPVSSLEEVRGGNNGGNRSSNYGMYTMNSQYRDPYMDNNRMQGNQM